MNPEKKESVKLKTFKSWFFKEDLIPEVNEDNGYVDGIQCKYCSQVKWDSLVAQSKRLKISEAALKGISNYINGTTYVHYGNAKRHVTNKLHEWAKSRCLVMTKADDSTSNANPHVETPPATSQSDSQPHIGASLLAVSKTHLQNPVWHYINNRRRRSPHY